MIVFIWVTWGQQPGDVRPKQGFRKAFVGPVVAFRSLKMATRISHQPMFLEVQEWWETPKGGMAERNEWEGCFNVSVSCCNGWSQGVSWPTHSLKGKSF